MSDYEAAVREHINLEHASPSETRPCWLTRFDLLDAIQPFCKDDSAALRYPQGGELGIGWIYGEEDYIRAIDAFRAGTLLDETFNSINKKGVKYVIKSAERLGLVPHRNDMVKVFCIDLDDHTGDGGNVGDLDALKRFIGAEPVVFTSRRGKGFHCFYFLQNPMTITAFKQWFKGWGFNRSGMPEIFPKTHKLTQIWFPNEPNEHGGDMYVSGTLESCCMDSLPDAPSRKLSIATLRFLMGMVRQPGRNDALNKAAFEFGQKGVGRGEAEALCKQACRLCGLYAEEPEQCDTTFESGFSAGMSQAGSKRPGARADDDEQDDSEFPVPLGQRDPVSNRLILSPKKTLPTARAFCDEFYVHPDGCTLHAYAGSFWVWDCNRYIQTEDSSITAQVFPWLHRSLRYELVRKTGELKLVGFDANPSTTGAALESIRALVHIPSDTPMPAWLDDDPEHPTPHEIVVCRNGNLHIPSGKFSGPTPSLWTTCATEFDYDPDAPTPSRWLAFLEETFGGDAASIALLQEWFGYCLIPDTRQQKALLISGSKRSGKGTVGRVLTALLGASNVVSPTTSSLATNFGLQPLIGKTLAVVSDARFVDLTHPRWAPFFEIILCVTGEDAVTIDRKYKEQLTIRLMTRFVFLSNKLPNFAAVSEALASRFLVLQTRGSRYGREDPDLTAKLLMELPGIFLWSIEGWQRLHERGRFVQPDLRESDEDEDPLDAFQGPARRVAKFVAERCVVECGQRVPVDELYQAWCLWAKPQGAADLNTQMLGRYLHEVAQGVQRRRGTGGAFYDGVGLKGSD